MCSSLIKRGEAYGRSVLGHYNFVIMIEFIQIQYDKDHETIQAIVQYVWEHTRDVREAIAIAKIVYKSDEVTSIISTLRRYSNEMMANNKRGP